MKKPIIDPTLLQSLDDLRSVPPRHPAAAARGKAYFLNQAEKMRSAASRKQETRGKNWFRSILFMPPGKGRFPVLRPVTAAALAAVIFFGGSTTTVYAAQESLPDQGLYPLKILSEDAALWLTGSSQAHMDYELEFSDRRIAEMGSLAAAGMAIPDEVLTRFQSELDQALELAAGMQDAQMLQRLEQIRLRAETQLGNVNTLIESAPGAGQPLLLRARARIQEQVHLCSLGEMDPGEYRLQIRQRLQYRGGSEEDATGTPEPTGTRNGSGWGGNQPTGTPGHYGPGAQSTSQPGGGSGNKP